MAERRAEERRLRRLCAVHGTLCLTYDDGPGTRLTPAVLDLLAEHGATATFFPLGGRADGAPDVLGRALAEGHELGCHGHSHVDALSCERSEAAEDIARGYAALSSWIAADAPYRPPYGRLSAEARRALRTRGAPVAWWTADSGDALLAAPDAGPVLETVERAGGGVVLMHDFDRDPPEPERERFVLDVTAALLELARRRGWRVAPVGTLLSGRSDGARVPLGATA
jgi:peptidoglycan-N-acetylglucosamine deacetylase